MNIFIPATEYPPYKIGGTGTFTYTLASTLKQLGNTIVVVTEVNNSIDSNGIHIHPLYSIHKHWTVKPLIVISKKLQPFIKMYAPHIFQILRFNLYFLFTFMQLHKKNNFDCIHTTTQFASTFLIGLLFPTIPQIAHVQGLEERLQSFDFVTPDSTIRILVERLYLKNIARKIIPCSKSIRYYLLKQSKSLKNKIVYIPNAIDTTSMSRPTLPTDVNTLVFWGRLEYRKGPDILLNAFLKITTLYPEMRLVFIGETTSLWDKNIGCFTYISNQKPISPKKINLMNITYMKPIHERQELIKKIKQINGIAVFPSRYEPFGYVYIESMLAGCITIASSRGAGKEIISHAVDGYVINPTIKNIVDTVKKIRSLSKKSRLAIQTTGQKKVISSYNQSYIASHYLRVHNQIFNKK